MSAKASQRQRLATPLAAAVIAEWGHAYEEVSGLKMWDSESRLLGFRGWPSISNLSIQPCTVSHHHPEQQMVLSK